MKKTGWMLVRRSQINGINRRVWLENDCICSGNDRFRLGNGRFSFGDNRFYFGNSRGGMRRSRI